ncbi:hypothetical protein H072_11185 [Dactylellina haptotyla CBS 200.50]|uniref:Methyltransferase domain-containing protein n=1 Tax=Dactylellina haptotyla (strain CBS 200.50) TaxID=1284197 RepID=S7ZXG4_DACHA|nr:hypothetical protein H072_11185 [Dactylellina haptotyla CBS 200.50]
MSASGSSLSETCSLDSAYRRTIRCHGREFQEYSVENLIYPVPVDEDEADRLNRQHALFRRMFDNRLVFPPLEEPKRILDCGYGSGAWAIEAAETYPDAEIIGIDISPHLKPDETPGNLWCQFDDLNDPFNFRPGEFDLVHSRLVAPGINKNRWSGYLRDCFKVLKSDGWLQMVEIYFNVQSDNGTLTEDHGLRRWSKTYLEVFEDTKDLRAPTRLQALMERAGFVDVQSRMMPLPLNGWPRSSRDREIGNLNANIAKELINCLALWPFTERHGMSLEQYYVLIARARNEIDDLTLRPYFPL